jgi:hypothetical protein
MNAAKIIFRAIEHTAAQAPQSKQPRLQKTKRIDDLALRHFHRAARRHCRSGMRANLQ